MFKKLILQNFKCFNDITTFDLGKINLLAGANGRGKSTVCQSLLLIAQSVYEYKNIECLLVNGIFVNLDLFDDLLYKDDANNVREELCLELETIDNASVHKMKMGYKELSDRKGILSTLYINGENKFAKKENLNSEFISETASKDASLGGYPREEVNKLFRDFYYISADRIGPTRREDKCDECSVNPIGKLGEHRLNLLSSNTSCNQVFCPEGEDSDNLIHRTEKWLKYIMGDGTLQITGNEKESSVLDLHVGSKRTGRKYKSINVGFGYSYILSIIETALVAPKGCVVLIENPEAHLHPAAQSRLCRLFVSMAEYGMQLFIETHSEHILNGLRLRTIDSSVLTHEDMNIYYFNDDYKPQIVRMDKDGFIEEWPQGFFDQSDIDNLAFFTKKYRK